MQRALPGRCHMCDQYRDVASFEIYWIGSEGLRACLPCTMKITEFVRDVIREKNEKRKQAMLKAKAASNQESDGGN